MTIGGKNSGERGSVLMETILVIPLYIAFLSGIFMLGDLGLGRSRLNAGDRFAVWLAGDRHANKDDAAVKKAASGAFFPKNDFAEGTSLESFSSHKTKVNFYAVVQGAAKLKLALPAWAVNSRKSVLMMFGGSGTSSSGDGDSATSAGGGGADSDRWDKVSLRAREIDGKYTHSVLMRAKYDIRDRSGRELAQGAPLWHIEYRTAYINRDGVPNDRPGALAASGVSEYTRLPQFDSWSR